MENVTKELRSVRTDLFTPAETAILNAQYELEKAGADVKLTEATILLSKARSLVSEYFYEKESEKIN